MMRNVALIVVAVVLSSVSVWSDKKLSLMDMTGVRPGDCRDCHASLMVQQIIHENTQGMDSSSCVECHEEDTTDLRRKIPLSHIHFLKGISCQDCHDGTVKPKPLTSNECLKCHESAERMAMKTENLDPNPHNSPHYGFTLDCDLCHRLHSKSENFCSQCHEWELLVP